VTCEERLGAAGGGYRGLISVIRALLQELAEPGDITVHLDDRVREELSPETCEIVCRIVDECVTNIRAHAHARDVVVAMESTADGIQVMIEDNGTGFDVAKVGRSPTGDASLRTMRERAEASGGWYRVDSSPGNGTTTEFWIPSSPMHEADRGSAS
jgi:signal transduction histidine kinase